MPTTTTYADPNDLDVQNARAIERITRERSYKRLSVLALLGAGLLALFGMTYAMYARTPATIPAYRTGTSSPP